MVNMMMLVAVICFVAAIIMGFITSDSWKTTAICWALLLIGTTIFGIVLTL